MRCAKHATLVALFSALTGCAATGTPLPTVPSVDIPRFMGDWYVIACIPTRIERDAFDAVESYRLAADGRVLTTFTFRAGGFAGPLKRYQPVGFVRPDSHGAIWGMQFLWPIKAEYRVMYLNEDYTQTIIARQKRDYAWIMARTPTLADADYARLTRRLAQAGYEMAKLRRVPQRARTAAEP